MSTCTVTSQRINLNDLSQTQRCRLNEEIYNSDSYFHALFQQDQIEKPCQPIASSLRNEIERILLEKKLIQQKIPLENLHEVLSEEMKAYNFDDGVNKISTYFYETDVAFQRIYFQFIKLLREQYIQEPFWFQSTPTIRIHCPNAINSNHYPRYHSDISYGHPPAEINIWVPLTDLLEGHSFKIMSVAASKKMIADYHYDFGNFIQSAIRDKKFTDECDRNAQPVTTALGDMLLFDARCVHTGDRMLSHTRISMDMRILPLSQYEKMSIQYQGSGRRKILFEPGYCYHQQDSDHLLQSEE